MKRCTVDGCDLTVLARGMCSKHYWRMKRHGTTDSSALAHQRRDPICSVDGCWGVHAAHGYCSKHYQRWLHHGHPQGGRFHHGPQIGYQRAHQIVRELNGKATGYPCAHCAAQADEWAYDHADPNELIGTDHGRELPYSLVPDHYMPLCRPCHRRFDANQAAAA